MCLLCETSTVLYCTVHLNTKCPKLQASLQLQTSTVKLHTVSNPPELRNRSGRRGGREEHGVWGGRVRTGPPHGCAQSEGKGERESTCFTQIRLQRERAAGVSARIDGPRRRFMVSEFHSGDVCNWSCTRNARNCSMACEGFYYCLTNTPIIPYVSLYSLFIAPQLPTPLSLDAALERTRPPLQRSHTPPPPLRRPYH